MAGQRQSDFGEAVKAAGNSAAGLVLASGQFHVATLYRFDLVQPSAASFFFTTWDVTLTVGDHTYLTNLHIQRGPVTQKAGVEVQTLDLDVTPQSDGDAITIGGVPFLQAVRLGYLDGCRVTMSKLFMAMPGDLSAAPVPWFQGRVGTAECGRFSARVTVDSDVALLNVAMPRNLIQTGCAYRLFDAGCALNPATYQVAGAVVSVAGDAASMTTDLSAASNWFTLGRVAFTSGALNGLSFAVKTHLNASGAITLMSAPPLPPAPGDTFHIWPGCDKTRNTCETKFSNLAHFRGFPYVPIPEVMYGGTVLRSKNSPPGGQGKHHTTGARGSGSRRPGGRDWVP